MRKMTVIALLLTSMSMAGCGNSGPTLTSREKFVCTQCHKLPFPEQHSAAEWPGVVARMLTHMQQDSNRTIPNAQEQEEIIKFYQARAGR